MLNYMCKDRKVHAEEDLDSVLNTYRTKKLQVVKVLATIWYRGAIKLGPMPDKELNENVLADKSLSGLRKYADCGMSMEMYT